MDNQQKADEKQDAQEVKSQAPSPPPQEIEYCKECNHPSDYVSAEGLCPECEQEYYEG